MTHAKTRVNTKKNIAVVVKVGEGLVGVCVNRSCDGQPARKRVSVAINRGAFDSVISPAHVRDHERDETR